MCSSYQRFHMQTLFSCVFFRQSISMFSTVNQYDELKGWLNNSFLKWNNSIHEYTLMEWPNMVILPIYGTKIILDTHWEWSLGMAFLKWVIQPESGIKKEFKNLLNLGSSFFSSLPVHLICRLSLRLVAHSQNLCLSWHHRSSPYQT